jgi:hypothetical protein
MRSQPHYLVSRYERLILSPLSFLFYLPALYFFWHRAWILGAVILVLSFGVGGVAQALPHRKHETIAELAESRLKPFAGGFDGEITNEDARALGSAFVKTCLLINITLLLILLHFKVRWYWVFTALVALWPLFVVSSMLVIIGPGKVFDLLRSKRPTTES